jgi:hypothetical protein
VSPGAPWVSVSTRRIAPLTEVSTIDSLCGGIRPTENEDSRTRTLTSAATGALVTSNYD